MQCFSASLSDKAVGQGCMQWCNMLKAKFAESMVKLVKNAKNNNKAKLKPTLYVRTHAGKQLFLPACTYVQRGSTICFVVVVLVVVLFLLLLVLLLLLGTLVRILQYIQN
jgi:hypothetical protein